MLKFVALIIEIFSKDLIKHRSNFKSVSRININESLNMKIITFLFCSIMFVSVFAQNHAAKLPYELTPVGFAGVDTRGVATTTGGAGGKIINVTDAATLYSTLRSLRSDKNPSLSPAIIQVSGQSTLQATRWSILKNNANITLIGKGADTKFVGFGLEVETSQNIIIRNIEFYDCPVDGNRYPRSGDASYLGRPLHVQRRRRGGFDRREPRRF